MTIEARIQILEERLQENQGRLEQARQIGTNAQVAIHQISGALVVLREMLNESTDVRRPEGGDHQETREQAGPVNEDRPVGNGRLHGVDASPEG